jgi:hypothetical protein
MLSMVMSRSAQTFKADVSSVKYYFMKPLNMFNFFHNLQLVEGSRYLVEVEVEKKQ